MAVPKLRTIRIVNIKYNSCDVVGEVIERNAPNIYGNGIVWNTKGFPNINDGNVSVSGDMLGEFTLDVTNLIPNMNYYVRAFSISENGVGYGNEIQFTTQGIKTSTYLQFANDILTDFEINTIELNLSLSDIKNVTDNKTGYSLPIKIPYTPTNTQFFGTLYNVNNISEITDQKIECELYHENERIIDGYIYIESWDENFIEVIVARNDLGILELIKNKSLKDLDFTGSTYQYTGSTVYDYVNENVSFIPSGTTGYTDHKFVHYDWWGVAQNKITNYPLQNNELNELFNNKPLTPLLKIKTIFDKIFSDNDYTYNLSSSVEDKLDKMYMTTTAPIENFSTKVVTNYFFRETPSAIPNIFNIVTGSTTIGGESNVYCEINEFPNFSKVAGNGSSTFLIGYEKIVPPLRPNTEVECEIIMYGDLIDANENGEINLELKYSDADDNISSLKLPTLPINTGNTTTHASIKSKLKIPENFGTSGNYWVTISTTNCIPYSTSFQTGFENAGIFFYEDNHIWGSGNTYTFNDLLPDDYSQTNLIKDIIKNFNLNMYVDDDNKKHLNLLDYDEFNTNDYIDWSNKFSIEDIDISDTSKLLSTNYIYSNNQGSDKIEKSFVDKNKNQFKYNNIENNNQISKIENSEIKIESGNNKLFNNLHPYYLITNDYIDYDVVNRNSDSHLIVKNEFTMPIGSYYDKYNSKVLFGFINSFYNNSDNTFNYMPSFGQLIGETYIQSAFNNLVKVKNYLTFSPYQLQNSTWNAQEIESNVFSLSWGTENTMVDISGSTITNSNLYTNYWYKEMEKKINTQQRYLKCKIELNPFDLNIENFRKLIWIKNNLIGDAYYRLQNITYSSNQNNLASVELITDNLRNVNALPTTITPKVWDWNFTDEIIFQKS